MPGACFLPAAFTPGASKHHGEACFGVKALPMDPGGYTPYETGLQLMDAVRRL